ncbi:hypothetical protein, partial [Kaarinaea lacus]
VPLPFALIESACGYRKAYSEWPVLNSQEDSSESFEIVSINAEEEQLETVFKFRKLSYLLDVKILNKNEENTGKECYVYINGVNANGDSLFKSERPFVLGESMISKDEKVAYARTFMLFNTFANFAAQSEQSSEKKINEKPSAGAEFLGAIGGAVLKVGICILLNVEPGNCR